jgi:predicted ATPase
LIDWRHNLLDEPERSLFWRLSVFVGGCCATGPEHIAAVAPIVQERRRLTRPA